MKRYRKVRHGGFKKKFSSFRRGARRQGQGIVSDLGKMGYGAGYGAGRKYVVDAIQGLINKLPFGKYNDNAVMGLLAIAARRFTKQKMVTGITEAALYTEGAMIGSEATQNIGSINGTTTGGLLW